MISSDEVVEISLLSFWRSAFLFFHDGDAMTLVLMSMAACSKKLVFATGVWPRSFMATERVTDSVHKRVARPYCLVDAQPPGSRC